jgi:hypothetical protein
MTHWSTVRNESRAKDPRSLSTAIAQTDPKLRGPRPSHDFFRENSDGIFDGISDTQPEIIQ